MNGLNNFSDYLYLTVAALYDMQMRAYPISIQAVHRHLRLCNRDANHSRSARPRRSFAEMGIARVNRIT